MGDPTRGLYEKFRVMRTDGRSALGMKHHGCRYFVLDVDHDPFAAVALAAYGAACMVAMPKLGYQLLDCVACLKTGGVSDAYGEYLKHP